MRLILATALLVGAARCWAQQAAEPPPASEQQRVRQALEWNKQGMAFFAQGKIGDAAREFGKVYAWYPNNPDVAFNYGMALTAVGEYREAIPALEKTVGLRPLDGAAHLNLGLCYIGSGRIEDGVSQLQKTLETDPKNMDALFQLALAYHKLKQNDKAEECLRWLSERNSESPQIHLYIARAERIAKSYLEADREIAKALELEPQLAEAHFERGVIVKAEGHFEDAEKSFQEALRLRPEVPKYNQALAQLYLVEFHDVDRAIPYFQKVVEYNPDNAAAQVDLGDAYLKKGDLATGEPLLRRAIELDPQASRPHYLLGVLLRRKGRKEEAEKEFSAAAKLAPAEHHRPAPDEALTTKQSD
jgi:tetratricopeptide (TPR) repeat protein